MSITVAPVDDMSITVASASIVLVYKPEEHVFKETHENVIGEVRATSVMTSKLINVSQSSVQYVWRDNAYRGVKRFAS